MSCGFTEGFYSKPRVDRETLERYSEGLIALSACLAGRRNVYGLWFIRLCPFFAVIFAFTVKSLQLESSRYYLKEGNTRTHLTRELFKHLVRN